MHSSILIAVNHHSLQANSINEKKASDEDDSLLGKIKELGPNADGTSGLQMPWANAEPGPGAPRHSLTAVEQNRKKEGLT